MNPTLADILAASERIRDAIVLTPVVPALALRDRLPCAVHLKLENTQRTGSFKDRGALNRMLALSGEERTAGIVTAARETMHRRSHTTVPGSGSRSKS